MAEIKHLWKQMIETCCIYVKVNIGFLLKNFVGLEMFRHFTVTIEQVKVSKSNV